MSGLVTTLCASRLSLLLPPVAPWVRVPPVFCGPLLPPSPEPPPQAASEPAPATPAAATPEYRSTWRRERPC